jgi:hypothetical protein
MIENEKPPAVEVPAARTLDECQHQHRQEYTCYTLLIAQRDQRVDFAGTARGNVARQ